MVMNHYVFPSLPYLPYPYLRKLGWWMFGTPKVKGMNGILGFVGPLMIRK